MQGYILFAHGARDPDWAGPLHRLREAVARQAPHADVRVAFLEFMSPDLAAAINDAVGAGVRDIEVVPVFLAQGGHVKRDLPMIVDAARRSHPQVRIQLQGAVGEAPEVIEAMAAAAVGK